MARALTEEERESLKMIVAWLSDQMRRSDWCQKNRDAKGLEVDLVRLVMYLETILKLEMATIRCG